MINWSFPNLPQELYIHRMGSGDVRGGEPGDLWEIMRMDMTLT